MCAVCTAAPMDTATGTACTLPQLADITKALWISSLIFETVLCALVAYPGFQTFMLERVMGNQGMVLLKIIIRDSIVYYLA